MPTRRRTSKHRYSGVLPVGGDLELVIGPAGQCTCPPVEVGAMAHGELCASKFASDEQREGAYWAIRERLVEHLHASRPWGWWRYEAPGVCLHKPPCAHPEPFDRAGEAEWLAFHGDLDAAERSRVLSAGAHGGWFAEVADAVRRGLREAGG